MDMKNFLLENGIYPNLRGFRYLVQAVEVMKKQKYLKIVTELYPTLAKEFNTTVGNIERGIRYVTDRLYPQVLKKYGINRKVTNKELIYYFALS